MGSLSSSLLDEQKDEDCRGMRSHRYYHWLVVAALALLLAILLLDRVVSASICMQLLGWDVKAKQIQTRALWSWVIAVGIIIPKPRNDSRWAVCRLLGKIPVFLRLTIVWLIVLVPFYNSERRFWETAAYVKLHDESRIVRPGELDVDFVIITPSRFPGRIYYDARVTANREGLLLALKKKGLETIQQVDAPDGP